MKLNEVEASKQGPDHHPGRGEPARRIEAESTHEIISDKNQYNEQHNKVIKGHYKTFGRELQANGIGHVSGDADNNGIKRHKHIVYYVELLIIHGSLLTGVIHYRR